MAWTSIDTQKLVLEYIKVLVILVGVVFALFELNRANREQLQARYTATAEQLAAFGDQRMIDGMEAFSDATTAPRDEATLRRLLRKLAPIRQRLVTWAACVGDGICLQGPSRELMCARMISYETGVQDMMELFGKSYDRSLRSVVYFGELERCEADYSASSAAIRE